MSSHINKMLQQCAGWRFDPDHKSGAERLPFDRTQRIDLFGFLVEKSFKFEGVATAAHLAADAVG
jgi:hypothetical protein